MKNMEEIGKSVKELRLRANLTQKNVADFLSLDQSMVAKIEKGERALSSDVIEMLSSLFCCPIESILEDEEPVQSCAVSFRRNSLSAEDLRALSDVNKIVMNQFEMDKITGGKNE